MEKIVKKAISMIAVLSLVLVLFPTTLVNAEEVDLVEEVVEEVEEVVEEEATEDVEEIEDVEEEEVEVISEESEEEEASEEESDDECVNLVGLSCGSSFSGSTQYVTVNVVGKGNVNHITGSVTVQDISTGRVVGVWSINKWDDYYSVCRSYGGAVRGHRYEVGVNVRLTNTSGYTETISGSNIVRY